MCKRYSRCAPEVPESKSSAEHAEQDLGERLGEDIGELVVCWHVDDFHGLVLDLLPNEEVSCHHVFGLLAELVVLGQSDGRLVVLVDGQRREVQTEVLSKLEKPGARYTREEKTRSESPALYAS